jgi:hypothetical protein
MASESDRPATEEEFQSVCNTGTMISSQMMLSGFTAFSAGISKVVRELKKTRVAFMNVAAEVIRLNIRIEELEEEVEQFRNDFR